MATHQKIPATIITGFLGAGKTTLISKLMASVSGKRLALIVNEFGDVGIDGETLKACGITGCDDDSIIELANGCICCTVADDFLPTMQALLARNPRPDHIIIETSGLALPQPLVKAFRWPDIRAKTSVDGVITLVDGEALAQGLYVMNQQALDAQRADDESLDHDSPIEELFEDQITAADLILISKTDRLSREQSEAVVSRIHAEARPGTGILCVSNGDILPSILLGMDKGVEDLISERPTHHEREGFEDHDHDDFTSFILTLPAQTDAERFSAILKDTIETFGLLRVKGFIDIEDKPMRLALQAVGPRVDFWFDRPWADGEPRQTRLVFIGESGLDQSAIKQKLHG